MTKKVFQLALTLVPKVGPVTTRNLVSYCGCAQSVFEASDKFLSKIPGIGPQIIRYIKNDKLIAKAEAELDFLVQHNIKPVFYLDKSYPARLSHLPNSPAMLYYAGNASLNAPRAVAIVGTRKPSPHGLKLCEEFVEALARYQPTIISGLAYGIDIAVHKACLTYNIPTIGVLGHGLRQIYPPAHKSTAFAMIKNGGLLTEYTSDTRPDKEHFPMRNRIVAGLCDALIVIETQRKGGSMITANIANEYNKDVFAVPGRIKDNFSSGCNLLIKSHRAHLIESINDLAYIMRWEELDAQKHVQQQLFVELNKDEKLVVDLLKQQEKMSIDQLTHFMKLPGSKIAGLLLELEFKGVIKPLPGNNYILV
jgi:DNA processing protein